MNKKLVAIIVLIGMLFVILSMAIPGLSTGGY